MKNYAKYQREHRRLAILRTLSDADGSQANESILTQVLNDLGLTTSRDTVQTDLAWLHEQGLTKNETIFEIVVARVTRRGTDVAAGRATVPGVQKPSLED